MDALTSFKNVEKVENRERGSRAPFFSDTKLVECLSGVMSYYSTFIRGSRRA